jgi:hypothetical protein
MTIYLNGVKSGEVDVLTGFSTDNSGLGDLFIGGDGSTNFNGIIDEVRIWNRSLTANEVQNSYPYPPMILPIGNMTINEESSLRFTVVAMDNNSNLLYSVSNLPLGASFSPLSTQESFPPYSSGPKFSWTPSSSQVGTHSLCFSVSNGVSSDSECITITVKKNCLLYESLCPSDSICRGDGVCTENVNRLYGADAKPTSDPLGGGVGYHNIIDPRSANFTVSTRSQLMNALQNAVSGQIIYVTDNATINLTGDQNIAIPAGVTLASGRGRNESLGALIYSDANSDAFETFQLFIVAGEGVRVTGLRLQGPDPERRTEQMIWQDAQGRYNEIPNSFGIWSSYSHLTVDNCELFGWSYATIGLETGSHDNYIHHNFIHHNQREGLGYGVDVLKGADALVEANVFDWNRHSIAGSRGSPGASYEARYNLVLGNANSHYFDMHGGNDISDPTVPAGGYVKVHHNTFMESAEPAVAIRGVPTEGVWVYRNWALYDPNKFTTGWIFTQSLGNLSGHTPYENMWVYDNWYGLNPPPPTPAASTKGGVFLNGGWWLDANGDGIWDTGDDYHKFGSSGVQAVTGDWNLDGKDEIGVFYNEGWWLDANADGTWDTGDEYHTFGSPGVQAVTGDWNHDGNDEIGVFLNGGWWLDANGDGTWDTGDEYHTFGSTEVQAVTGDWNNNGKDEIGVFYNGGWWLDIDGDGTWDTGDEYHTFGSPGVQAVTGDWNNNGKDEIGVFYNGGWWLDIDGDGIWNTGDEYHTFGSPGVKAVTGDWKLVP